MLHKFLLSFVWRLSLRMKYQRALNSLGRDKFQESSKDHILVGWTTKLVCSAREFDEISSMLSYAKI